MVMLNPQQNHAKRQVSFGMLTKGSIRRLLRQPMTNSDKIELKHLIFDIYQKDLSIIHKIAGAQNIASIHIIQGSASRPEPNKGFFPKLFGKKKKTYEMEAYSRSRNEDKNFVPSTYAEALKSFIRYSTEELSKQ